MYAAMSLLMNRRLIGCDFSVHALTMLHATVDSARTLIVQFLPINVDKTEPILISHEP